jgi:DNA-binding transcriptional MerR regulator
MKIGNLSERTGVSVRSLRYYEEQGLLLSTRTAGGHRTYPETAVDRVIRIQELFAAGLNSAKIVEILPCMRDVDGSPSEHATPRLTEELRAERDRIDRQILEIQRTREVLSSVIATAAIEEQPHRQETPPDPACVDAS